MNNAMIETYTGQLVNLIEPNPATLNFKDIAWSLSRTSRFNGHTAGEQPLSVAQHSSWVARQIQLETGSLDPALILHALLHDAHEAYTGYILSPLKLLAELKPIKAIEMGLQAAIDIALDLPLLTVEYTQLIKHFDIIALAFEAKNLINSKGDDGAWNLPELPSHLREVHLNVLTPQEAFQEFWMSYELAKRGVSLDVLYPFKQTEKKALKGIATGAT